MATQVINYHCPSCDAPLHFAGASGRLECEYCGSSFEAALEDTVTGYDMRIKKGPISV